MEGYYRRPNGDPAPSYRILETLRNNDHETPHRHVIANRSTAMKPFEKKFISFDAAELCALDMAFENSKNAAALAALRKEFPVTYTSAATQFFKSTNRISALEERFRDFFLSARELVQEGAVSLRGASDLVILSCGHRTHEHRRALASILRKIDSL